MCVDMISFNRLYTFHLIYLYLFLFFIFTGVGGHPSYFRKEQKTPATFWVNCLLKLQIMRSRDPEINWFPGIGTWKSINFRVTRPGNQLISRSLRKKPNFVNISAKTKIFLKIFMGVNLGSRYYGFMKKKLQKSHATVPLKSCRSLYFTYEHN